MPCVESWSAANMELPRRGHAVDTTSVVLWRLVSQRRNPERTFESSMKRLIKTQPDFSPHNKRVLEKTLSNRTESYSRA